MDDSPCLIVGGGIAGLAASLGLARFGQSSHILEKAPAIETVGAGIQLGPNAVRALQYLGAWDAVAPHCISPEEIHIRDGLSGKSLQRIVLGKKFEQRFAAPYRVAHRADLQNGLLDCIRELPVIELQTNAEVVDAAIEQTSLTLKSGKTLNGRAIIAADGVHSILRKKICPEAPPNKIGQTLFRTLLPIETIPPAVEATVVTLWLYPGGHVVHYAVSGGARFNIVASLEDSNANPDTAFPNACPLLAQLLNMKHQWQTWPALDSTPNPKWCQNKTVLIGDAAHASLPYLAQGAAMALEDACMLTKRVHEIKSIPLAFKNFTENRFRRTAAIQSRSRQLGKIYHADASLRIARNIAFKIIPASLFAENLSWIYDWHQSKK